VHCSFGGKPAPARLVEEEDKNPHGHDSLHYVQGNLVPLQQDLDRNLETKTAATKAWAIFEAADKAFEADKSAQKKAARETARQHANETGAAAQAAQEGLRYAWNQDKAWRPTYEAGGQILAQWEADLSAAAAKPPQPLVSWTVAWDARTNTPLQAERETAAKDILRRRLRCHYGLDVTFRDNTGHATGTQGVVLLHTLTGRGGWEAAEEPLAALLQQGASARAVAAAFATHAHRCLWLQVMHTS